MAKRLAKIKGVRLDVERPRGKGWYRRRNLIVVWDVLLNDWRMIDLSKPSKWRILDFVPFTTEPEFKKVANVWVRDFKRIKYPDGPKFKSYCNYFKTGW